jgi:hypothetical protein
MHFLEALSALKAIAGSPCWQMKADFSKVPIRESILKKFGFIRLHPPAPSALRGYFFRSEQGNAALIALTYSTLVVRFASAGLS